MLFRLFTCLALGWPIASNAQPSADTHPADAGVVVPPVRYQSAFSTYRRYEEPKLGSWRDLNADVQKAAAAAMTSPPAAGTPSSGNQTPAEVNARKPGADQH